MKKNAFTLAEVLIVLGIIGIVSALTIPSLVANVNSNKIGPQLATFVSNMKNGLKNYMTNREMDNITNDDVMTALTSSMKASEYDATNHIYTFANGQSVKVEAVTVAKTATLPSGAPSGAQIPGYTRGAVSKVTLLINSKGVPGDMSVSTNPLRRDGYELFYFYVDAAGNVIPWGSTLCTYSYGQTYTCTTGALTGCAGVIMDNGWTAKGINFYN